MVRRTAGADQGLLEGRERAGRPGAAEEGDGAGPPVLLFLPGMSKQPHNTTSRLAEVMCADLSRGPGTYAVRGLDGPAPELTDGRRIVAADETPLLDLYTVAYRERLPSAHTVDGRAGVWAMVRMAITQVGYFLQAVVMLLDAGRRAKTRMAKWQLVVGFGAVALLLAAVAGTVVAILAALGVLAVPAAGETFADAVALGATGVTAWALARSGPTIREAAARIQQMIDYAGSQQQAVTVLNCLGGAIDAVLESPGRSRPVYILGYSMGALVAIDYLCPRTSQLEVLDERHAGAVRGLVTIGCPLDFVRLYLPAYMANRQPRIPGLPWTNVFIPADVLGSNMADGDDAGAPEPDRMVGVGGMKPTRIVQFTDETLTWSGIRARRGFLSHGGYWSVPGAGNCLGFVLGTVLAANRRGAAGAGT